MRKIPSIPITRVKSVIKHADNPDNWIDVDAGTDTIRKHIINHQGFQIIYTVDYKNNSDDAGGRLPIRHLSFQLITEVPKDSIQEFVERTLKQFGFTNPKASPGKKGRIHYYEQMFDI